MHKMTDREALDIVKETFIKNEECFSVLSDSERNRVIKLIEDSDSITHNLLYEIDKSVMTTTHIFVMLSRKIVSLISSDLAEDMLKLCDDYYIGLCNGFIDSVLRYFKYIYERSDNERQRELLCILIKDFEDNNITENTDSVYKELYIKTDFRRREQELKLDEDLTRGGDLVWELFFHEYKLVSYEHFKADRELESRMLHFERFGYDLIKDRKEYDQMYFKQ